MANNQLAAGVGPNTIELPGGVEERALGVFADRTGDLFEPALTRARDASGALVVARIVDTFNYSGTQRLILHTMVRDPNGELVVRVHEGMQCDVQCLCYRLGDLAVTDENPQPAGVLLGEPNKQKQFVAATRHAVVELDAALTASALADPFSVYGMNGSYWYRYFSGHNLGDPVAAAFEATRIARGDPPLTM